MAFVPSSHVFHLRVSSLHRATMTIRTQRAIRHSTTRHHDHCSYRWTMMTTTTTTTESQSDSSDENNEDDEVPFPTLYDAWFGPDHQLSSQACGALTRAWDAGYRKMEMQWPVVPNLEEISAGTLLNFEFGKQAARDLGMSSDADYSLIRRYLSSFGNLWWVSRLARSEALKDKAVWAVSTDSVSKSRAQDRVGENVKMTSLRNASEMNIGDEDVIVIMDPRFDEVWKKGMQLKPKNGAIIFLNSQFSEGYGLTGPRKGVMKSVECIYMLKRITRGYVFYSYPGTWRACLENPDMSIETLKRFEVQPELRQVAKLVREESNSRYGGFYNDRYVRGFGGRL